MRASSIALVSRAASRTAPRTFSTNANGTSGGAAFDRLFLTSMIRHHEGATAMVADLQTRPEHGQEVWIAQFAREVDLDQRVEIARMKGMLGTG